MKSTSAFSLFLSAFMMMNTAAYCQQPRENFSAQSQATPPSVKTSQAPDAMAGVQIAMTAGIPFPIPVPVTSVMKAVPSQAARILTRPVSTITGQKAPVGKAASVDAGKPSDSHSMPLPLSPKAKPQGAAAAKATAPTKATTKAAAKSAAKKKAARIKKADSATRIICSASAGKKKDSDQKFVALTFDDGPSPEYTPQILELLKKYDIHATFCLLGRQVKKYPELVKQIAAEGHKVADHSMNHDLNLSRRSDKKIKQEVMGERALIQSLVPEATVEYYRAPGGCWNYHVRKLVASWGMKPLGWSVDSRDWEQPGVESIISTVKAELHSGGVVLMHDAGGNRTQTIAALKKLIPTLKEDGYQFCFPD